MPKRLLLSVISVLYMVAPAAGEDTAKLGRCEKRHGSDAAHRARCIAEQREAKSWIKTFRASTGTDPKVATIATSCVGEWTTGHRLDWIMAKRCIEWDYDHHLSTAPVEWTK